LHCHILTHEDEGTMAQELVIDGGSCACDALYEEGKLMKKMMTIQ